jgi:tRNA-splicing ligase RtcB
MKYIQVENGLIIKSWCDAPEDGAVEQAKNLARLPFAFRQICLMPDTHQGYGMPIGGVMATEGVIVPNAVGVDIGCGMCALKTSLNEISIDVLKKIMGEIRNRIPVGFNKHKEKQNKNLIPEGAEYAGIGLDICHREYENALYSIGTLGGGNHFIEIQKGDDDHVWIMVHSGSRNLGKQVADHYNKKAVEINERYFSSIPKEWELAFFPMDDEIWQQYLSEMQFCVDFALANRKLMMERIVEVFSEVTGWATGRIGEIGITNIAHNYARMENHFGRNLLVHRKGATSARENETGIIPGSQGTSSYIVRGKGNVESFKSCSHGAGRKMGRKQAERTLNLEEEKKRLDDKGIIHSIRNTGDLDEAAGAYKDIDVVMAEQSDLVEIIVKLEPLGVIKG